MLTPGALAFVLPFMVPVAFVVAVYASTGGQVDGGSRNTLAAITALFAAEAVVLTLVATRRRVVLHEATITVRGVRHTRAVAASEIRSIVQRGFPTHQLALQTFGAAELTSPLLTRRELPMVNEWWLEHRGASLPPVSAPPPPVAPVAWWA